MRTSLLCILACAVACGPMAGHEDVKNPTDNGGSGAAGKPGAPGDVSFDITPPTEVKGIILEPDALYLPSWMLYDPKNKKMTLDKQRDVVSKAKDPVVREAQAAVLATMLYEKAKPEADETKKKDMYTE